jgi:crossover junction endodeoxyribonuclease RusA
MTEEKAPYSAEKNRTIVMPWPDQTLSPNARVHWAKKSAATKKYREYARLTALEKHFYIPKDRCLTIALGFHPPNASHYDLDNLLARMKSTLDGLFDANGANDEYIREINVSLGKQTPGGKVFVMILPLEE